jgi:hypothetical protein
MNHFTIQRYSVFCNLMHFSQKKTGVSSKKIVEKLNEITSTGLRIRCTDKLNALI